MIETMKPTVSDAHANGFRSLLEFRVALFLEEIKDEYNFEWEYESTEVLYEKANCVGHKIGVYLPDFLIIKEDGTQFFIEAKGRWDNKDRAKHNMVHATHPEIDIKLVFNNLNQKVKKNRKTSYGMYCQKAGWDSSNKLPLREWFEN